MFALSSAHSLVDREREGGKDTAERSGSKHSPVVLFSLFTLLTVRHGRLDDE